VRLVLVLARRLSLGTVEPSQLRTGALLPVVPVEREQEEALVCLLALM